MKKIFLILISVILITAFAAGCRMEDPLNPANTNSTDPSGSQSSEVDDMDYEDSIKGIYNYMLDLNLIANVEPTVMAADLIGAKEGNRYSYRLNGKQVSVELYSYDTENLNDTAKEIIESVRSKGSFEILDLGEVDALLSDSGKYLLVYSDKAFDSKNPNKDNVERRDRFIEAFKTFHN